MAAEIIYRVLRSMAEFEQVAGLERIIWNMPAKDSLSGDVLRSITHNGGVLIGAEADGELVGFTFGFASRSGGSWRLWSHATGVAKAVQGRGVGFQLKQAQRKWALENDYSIIAWTYDPMQRGNANFNMCRLGAIANVYHLDYYGEMADGINVGMKSDRFEAVWSLQDQRVVALTEGKSPVPVVAEYPENDFILRVVGDAFVTQPVDLTKQWLFAEIPYRLRALKQDKIDKARAWQLALRDVMLDAMGQGYTAVDFVTEENRCWYVLSR
jgi:chorismate synthase